MPLYNWEKCQNGDLTYTRSDDNETSHEQDVKAWEDLNYEYMEIFGVSRHHQRYLQLQRKLVCLEMELVETGRTFLKNQIRQTSDEIQNILREDKGKGMSIDGSLVYLSKFVGFQLNKRQ